MKSQFRGQAPEDKPMFWVAVNKGKSEIIETAGGSPPPNRDLTILGGYITYEQAEEKMNENQPRRPASWS
jgi:hypothetical protein